MTDASRPSGLGRRGAALASALIVSSVGYLFAVPAVGSGSKVPVTQRLVVLLHDRVARAGPSRHSGRIEPVAARRPLTRVRTVLPVLGHATADSGASWLRVRLPGRPNGHGGWISAERTKRSSTDWHIVVKRSTRRVTVYRGGRIRRIFRAVVGRPSTPTPKGTFFVEEAVALSPYDAGGPFALATSARSNVFQEFAGGPGQVGIHGTDNLPGALGTAVSHGCIRLGARAITWLARRIGAGVPLTIRR